MAFFFTSYVNPDGAAGLVIEVLKPQAFVLRTDHLICLSVMSEEFGTIDASSFRFRPSQATLTEAPEKFNASLMHGDHALVVSEISIRNHLGGIGAVLFLKTIHRKGQFLGIVGSLRNCWQRQRWRTGVSALQLPWSKGSATRASCRKAFRNLCAWHNRAIANL